MTTVNTNIGAISAQEGMRKVQGDLNQAIARLSSGLRINTAADDSAGTAIASKMDAQVRGLNQAIRNASDAQNLIDTTEGAHQEIESILQRLRELAVQSANDTNTVMDRTFLKSEQVALVAEIDRIANQTTWNGEKILEGSFSSKQFQVGANQDEDITVTVDSARSSALGSHVLRTDAHAVVTANTIDGEDLTVVGHLGSATVTVNATDSAKDLAAAVNAQTGSTGVEARAVTKAELSGLTVAEAVAFTLTGDADASISVTVTSTSDLGVLVDAINAQAATTGITAAQGSSAASIVLTHSTGEDIKIASFNTATTTTELTMRALDRNGAQLGTDDTITLEETAAGGTQPAGVVVGQATLESVKSFTVTGDDATAEDGFFHTINGTAAGGTSAISAVSAINIGSVSGAESAIEALDGAINKLNQSRADLGAISNRLTNTINNTANIVMNTEASVSNIRDADFAKETSALTKAQILNQAATSMLAQANASKQSVLALLQN